MIGARRVARMEKSRDPYRVLMWRHEGKRPLGENMRIV
jgi:hypothetical protein